MIIEKFSPFDVKFVFHLDGWCCYKQLTGKCSLEQDIDISENKESGYSCKWSYCRELSNAMLEGKFSNRKDFVPQIAKAHCGHYTITDGQHRLCVAKRKKIEISVDFMGESSCDCNICESQKPKIVKHQIFCFFRWTTIKKNNNNKNKDEFIY